MRGMRLDRPNINRRTDLWKTCVHEAGHWVLRTHYGFTPEWPHIISAVEGEVHYNAPKIPNRGMRSINERLSWIHSATCMLAGPAASRRVEWMPDGCSYDYANARRALRFIGPSYDFQMIMGIARADVREHWGRIEEIADRLMIEYIEKHGDDK